jgi:hypothetical protein
MRMQRLLARAIEAGATDLPQARGERRTRQERWSARVVALSELLSRATAIAACDSARTSPTRLGPLRWNPSKRRSLGNVRNKDTPLIQQCGLLSRPLLGASQQSVQRLRRLDHQDQRFERGSAGVEGGRSAGIVSEVVAMADYEVMVRTSSFSCVGGLQLQAAWKLARRYLPKDQVNVIAPKFCGSR